MPVNMGQVGQQNVHVQQGQVMLGQQNAQVQMAPGQLQPNRMSMAPQVVGNNQGNLQGTVSFEDILISTLRLLVH